MTPLETGSGRPGRVIGIDLGTTNSLVAYMDVTAPKVIPGEDGRPLVPSVVSLARDGAVLTGNAARKLLVTDPERTIYSVKRLMGRGAADIQDELRLFPFRIALWAAKADDGPRATPPPPARVVAPPPEPPEE